ncbi:endonuclease III domain-containing protein [Dictyobacter kobayashii]|uniref:HhH-GPD domain-containing protein n=1 Tax=Dictyobacter kobayashii TaxID=2014872 RepID=A0A402APJ2_9CHLR|nr:hypothetical protein [Dictyobacter kobayashii]GCE20949.1 hypothetical protein KDK_47490 [Dictyobacter kobayashii]
MSSTITPSIHLTRVYDILVDTYGQLTNEPDYDPLGGLVGTILSQHTSDINSGRAYRQLIKTFPTWEEVRDVPTHLVADAIRSGGLANVKAPRIQEVLNTLTSQQKASGSNKPLTAYLYDEIKKRTPEEAWRYLKTLPGVAPKPLPASCSST